VVPEKPHLTHLASHRHAVQHHSMQTPAAAALDPALRKTHSGYVHSIETAATLDGPGIRFAVFLSGCHFRCLYCHNPDTWKLKHGVHLTVDDLMQEIEQYADFLIEYEGGVTLSGGEVMVQAPFVETLVRRMKERGLHVAIDTNGYLGEDVSQQLMDDVDLWLLDIKAFDDRLHRRITGQSNQPVLEFSRRLSASGETSWIRFVLVPGLTDDATEIDNLAAFIASLSGVERVEVLPFHQMGAYKWDELGLDYALRDVNGPDQAMIDRVRQQFADRGLTVY
jgi:pyruvate formate lyase activating enzyme